MAYAAMTVFARAIDDLFADPNLAVDAVYLPEGGEPVPVRLIARRPDRVLEFGEARLHAETAVFDVRTSQGPNPRPGDRLDVGEEMFVIQGEPIRDSARLVWTLRSGVDPERTCDKPSCSIGHHVGADDEHCGAQDPASVPVLHCNCQQG
jgi:hypothetical protein